MPFGNDLSLGPKGANLIGDDGKLTKSARDKFVLDITSILLSGNEDGLGISTTGFLPIPIFPVAGPKIPPANENLFWFKSDPFAALSIPTLSDTSKEFQKLIVDGLYAPLVKMLNVTGKTPLIPILDPTCIIDLKKFPDLTLEQIPGIMTKLAIQFALTLVPATLPAAKIALATDFGISDAIIGELIPLIVAGPKLPIPPVPIPQIPPFPIPTLGSFSPIFPDLVLGICKIPTILFPQIITEITSPVIDPPSLLLKIVKLIIDLLIKLLQSLGLLQGVPKILLATLMVIVKNLSVILLCDVVSQVLGTGSLTKILAQIGGLT